jgi:predicted transposase YdaD
MDYLWNYLLRHSELQQKQIESIVETVADANPSINTQETKEKLMSTADMLIQKGRKEGQQKGRQEGRQEGLQEGRQEGEWIGKIQLMEQFLGRETTAKTEFEGRSITWLKAKFRELEKDYNKRFRTKS